jgi:hypothetical protein
MRFVDLLAMPNDNQSGIIEYDALRRILSLTPDEVIQQFYADHGRKDVLHKLYATIQPDHIDHWRNETPEPGCVGR